MFDTTQRRALWMSMYREERAKLVPNCDGGRLSGQQISYAKGRATKRFLAAEPVAMREP